MAWLFVLSAHPPPYAGISIGVDHRLRRGPSPLPYHLCHTSVRFPSRTRQADRCRQAQKDDDDDELASSSDTDSDDSSSITNSDSQGDAHESSPSQEDLKNGLEEEQEDITHQAKRVFA
ncbi:hypothetical protein H4Q26_002271 [Puccinia striiformis f. sp. tritici PST-130]|nr:hypothetical protein H4Q26_002271 [Puccinia striiformis f. sp. tritici PST-130]